MAPPDVVVEVAIGRRQEDRHRSERTAHNLRWMRSEVVRRGIGLVKADAERLAVWREEVRFIAERQKLPTLPGRRSWTREELYDRWHDQ